MERKKYDESKYVEKNIINSIKNHKTYKVSLDNFRRSAKYDQSSWSPIGGLGTFGVFQMALSLFKNKILKLFYLEKVQMNLILDIKYASFINEITDKDKQAKELIIFNKIYKEI